MRRETFSTRGALRLELKLAAGEIELEAAATDETTVELEPLSDNDASRAAVEDARIQLRERGDGHELVVTVREPRFGFSNVEVRLTVRAPEGAAVDLATASADVRGHGSFGDVEAKTASGDVRFDEVASFKARAASGDVSVQSVRSAASVNSASGDAEIGHLAGDGEFRTASGDVGIEQADASLSVHTASGDQEIGSVADGRVDLHSASGDIHLGVRPGSRIWVDARSTSGDVESELEVGDAPSDEEGPLVELRAATMSGDIEIVRAQARLAAS